MYTTDVISLIFLTYMYMKLIYVHAIIKKLKMFSTNLNLSLYIKKNMNVIKDMMFISVYFSI